MNAPRDERSCIDCLQRCNSDGTIVCLSPPGRFVMKRASDFLSAYQKDVEAGVPLCFAEVTENEGPVRVDVDLSVEYVDDDQPLTPLYTELQLKRATRCVQASLTQILDFWQDGRVPVQEEMLACVVLEKKPYVAENAGTRRLKHGFHLHFPFCIVDSSVLSSHLLPYANHLLDLDHCFPSSSPIDIHATKNPWLMYGSSKGLDREPYKATHLWDVNLTPLSMMSMSKMMEGISLPKDWPALLSIRVKDRAHLFKHVIKQDPMVTEFWRKNQESERFVDTPEAMKEEDVIHLLNQLKPYLDLIDASRRTYTNVIPSVGKALYSETSGSTVAFSLWRQWVNEMGVEDEKSEAELMQDWLEFRGSRYSKGIIYHHAKHCQPETYERLKREHNSNYIKKILNKSDRSIAELDHQLLGDTFKCVDAASGEGYVYRHSKTPIWTPVSKEFIFCRYLKEDPKVITVPSVLKEFYKQIVKENAEAVADDADDDEDEGVDAGVKRKFEGNDIGMKKQKREPTQNEVLLEKCWKVQEKISDMTGIRSVASAFFYLTYDRHFLDSVDIKAHLTAFKNGVLNTETFDFYPGLPSDKLTRNVNASYDAQKEETDPDVLCARQFFAQLFPDPQLRDYALGCIAMTLYGRNIEKTALFLSGTGDNGKSVLVRVIHNFLDKLACCINVSHFHSDFVNAQAANPELNMIRGTRLVYVSEAVGNFKTGLLKRLTGSDTITTRDLHKSSSSFIPQCQLWFPCNTLPPIHPMDKAIENRIRVLPFESTFYNEKDISHLSEEERWHLKKFPKDDEIERKISNDALAYIIVKQLKTCFGNRITPEKVMIHSKEYSLENNVYAIFKEKCIASNPSNSLKLDEAFDAFIGFVSSTLPHLEKNLLTKGAFKTGMSQTLLQAIEASPNGMAWKGVCLKESMPMVSMLTF